LTSANQTLYQTSNIVQFYEQIKDLQPAEQMILDRFATDLPTMRMLDIGVGAGRTTQYFCDRAAHYIGIDYSPEMIDSCQQRFPETEHRQFKVCDARDLSCFIDQQFDFVLFSFNGIDYVEHVDRLTILKEIHRVSKPGAVFCFSSHNLQSFENAFSFKAQWSWNPIATYTDLFITGILRLLNRPLSPAELEASSYKIVKDESHNFKLNTYYIRPIAQIEQLAKYFQDIQIYPWNHDAELVTEGDRRADINQWLYYICKTSST
jgi:ubiquinone/menaquinone biosynthesis C-methylase UbiE